MKFIIAKKVGMTQRFREDGTVVPVTLLQADPCTVTQVKTDEKDGYSSVQVGFGVAKEKNLALAQRGHLKACGKQCRNTAEFRIDGEVELNVGDSITAEQFAAGEFIHVTATSKGKGFQGVMKRHGFKCSPATHGHKDQHRMPGSIAATGPAHVFKGTRMGGRMGGDQVTVKNLEIVDVDAGQGVLAIKGAVPGARGAVVVIRGGFDKRQSWN